MTADVFNLEKLCAVPDNDRNTGWEDQFLTSLSASSVYVLSPDPQTGPDGWPYLYAATKPATLDGYKSTESQAFQKISHWLSTRGIGLVINPHKDYPDFVLTYGMLWSFHESGKFIHRQIAESNVEGANDIEISTATLKHAGSPNEKYLPLYVRSVLKAFFVDQGVFQVRILLVSLDMVKYELAFSAESLRNPPHAEWPGIAEAISWFLPLHYSILILSESGLPGFSEL